MCKALSGELSCRCDRSCCIIISDHSEYLYNVITCNHKVIMITLKSNYNCNQLHCEKVIVICNHDFRK